MCVSQVDDNVGHVMSELKRLGLWGHVNLLVTSDHGMAQCAADRLIRLDDCLHPDNYTLVDVSPVAAIIPIAGSQRLSDVFGFSLPVRGNSSLRSS